jgi:hypothetical protein
VDRELPLAAAQIAMVWKQRLLGMATGSKGSVPPISRAQNDPCGQADLALVCGVEIPHAGGDLRPVLCDICRPAAASRRAVPRPLTEQLHGPVEAR